MSTFEYERTFLAKYLPKDLASFPSKEIFDIYIPELSDNAKLRLRKHDERYEITKKEPVGMTFRFNKNTRYIYQKMNLMFCLRQVGKPFGRCDISISYGKLLLKLIYFKITLKD
jgi:hypothetical protein